MPRASAADAARTAQRVRQCAERLFSTAGYAAASLDDVAQEAGVTRGAVYHHYRSKKGLFQAVAAGLHEEVAAAVERAAEQAGDDPRIQLRAGSHAFLDAITSARAARVLLVDAPTVGWQEWHRSDAEHSGALLRRVLEEIGVERSEATAVQLSGAMNEAALWVARHSDPETARADAHAVLDRLLDAVLAPTS